MSTPTPRTSSAIIASGFQAVPEGFRAFAGILERELTALTAERDQLCAALALGQINCDDAYDDLRDERDAAIARAESAEREAFDWKKIARYEAARAERAEREVAGLKANNRFQRGHSAGYAEAKADCATELAAERARLDYLSTRGFEHRHHETGDHLGYEWTISSYSESEDVTLRDVIDAEMREDEK